MTQQERNFADRRGNYADASGANSVAVGGDNKGPINTGFGNRVIMTSTSYRSDSTPASPQEVLDQLVAIRQLLEGLGAPDQFKINNALAEAEAEVKKPSPSVSEIGTAIERAVKYAAQAEQFASNADKLKAHLIPLASWLGSHWVAILSYL